MTKCVKFKLESWLVLLAHQSGTIADVGDTEQGLIGRGKQRQQQELVG
jgi:hypothetical protein